MPSLAPPCTAACRRLLALQEEVGQVLQDLRGRVIAVPSPGPGGGGGGGNCRCKSVHFRKE